MENNCDGAVIGGRGVLSKYYEAACFGIIGAAAVVVGLVVGAIAPRISRLMEGVH